jgi:hypothetical protein
LHLTVTIVRGTQVVRMDSGVAFVNKPEVLILSSSEVRVET